MNTHISTNIHQPQVSCELSKTVAEALTSWKRPVPKLVAKVQAAQKAMTANDERMALCSFDAKEKFVADESRAFKEGRIQKLSDTATVAAAYARENNLLVEMNMEISNEISPTNNEILAPAIAHMKTVAEDLKAADHAACEKWGVPVCCGMPYHGLKLAIRQVEAQIKTGKDHGTRPKDALAGIVSFPTD